MKTRILLATVTLMLHYHNNLCAMDYEQFYWENQAAQYQHNIEMEASIALKEFDNVCDQENGSYLELLNNIRPEVLEYLANQGANTRMDVLGLYAVACAKSDHPEDLPKAASALFRFTDTLYGLFARSSNGLSAKLVAMQKKIGLITAYQELVQRNPGDPFVDVAFGKHQCVQGSNQYELCPVREEHLNAGIQILEKHAESVDWVHEILPWAYAEYQKLQPILVVPVAQRQARAPLTVQMGLLEAVTIQAKTTNVQERTKTVDGRFLPVKETSLENNNKLVFQELRSDKIACAVRDLFACADEWVEQMTLKKIEQEKNARDLQRKKDKYAKKRIKKKEKKQREKAQNEQADKILDEFQVEDRDAYLQVTDKNTEQEKKKKKLRDLLEIKKVVNRSLQARIDEFGIQLNKVHTHLEQAHTHVKISLKEIKKPSAQLLEHLCDGNPEGATYFQVSPESVELACEQYDIAVQMMKLNNALEESDPVLKERVDAVKKEIDFCLEVLKNSEEVHVYDFRKNSEK